MPPGQGDGIKEREWKVVNEKRRRIKEEGDRKQEKRGGRNFFFFSFFSPLIRSPTSFLSLSLSHFLSFYSEGENGNREREREDEQLKKKRKKWLLSDMMGDSVKRKVRVSFFSPFFYAFWYNDDAIHCLSLSLLSFSSWIIYREKEGDTFKSVGKLI